MLAPCPSCARHVRTTERTCPFCAAPLPESPHVVPGASQRLTRAAAYAFTATLAATGAAAGAASGLEACGGSTTETKDDAGNNAIYGAPAYGAQPVDASADAPRDGARDATDAADTGAEDAGRDADNDAGGQALYGAPAVPGRNIDPKSE